MPDKLIKMGQGPAKLADKEALDKDELGFTNLNLHRRVDPVDPEKDSGEVQPRDYIIGIQGTDSYRTTIINTHDEESTTQEIP